MCGIIGTFFYNYCDIVWLLIAHIFVHRLQLNNMGFPAIKEILFEHYCISKSSI
jgi:hypothetical protein